MIKNTQTTYGAIAKSFHWIMATLFVGMFIVAYIMINLSKSDFKFSLYDLHKATGLLLFGLVALRLSWRLFNASPKLPRSIPAWQRIASSGNILLLYFLMFAMPITGFLTSTLGGHAISFYGTFHLAPLANSKPLSETFSNAHEILSYLLLAAFTLHLAATIYHHYILKDEVIGRMWKA